MDVICVFVVTLSIMWGIWIMRPFFDVFFFSLFDDGVQQTSLSIQIFVFSFSLGFGWKPVMHMNVRMNANSPIDTNRPRDYNINSDKIVRCGFSFFSKRMSLFWLCLTWLRKECFFCILLLPLRPSHRLSAYRMNDINDVDTYK